MDERMRWASSICLLVWGVGIAGCSLGRESPTTRLYLLRAMSGADVTQEVPLDRLVVGLGPVRLPSYTDQSQIVTGAVGNELVQAPFDQWAEPLEDNVARVLLENMAAELAPAGVAVFAWQALVPIDYQVAVAVSRFLGQPNGAVSLVARWTILPGDAKSVLLSRQSSYSETSAGNGYNGLVAAFDRTLISLSRDIAEELKRLPPAGGKAATTP